MSYCFLEPAFLLIYKPSVAGCNKQACNFRDNYSEFKKHGFTVYALSADAGDAQNEWQSKVAFSISCLNITSADVRL